MWLAPGAAPSGRSGCRPARIARRARPARCTDGLRALRRTGIYMLQDYCRRLGIGTSPAEIKDLAASLRALPPDHPLDAVAAQCPGLSRYRGGAGGRIVAPAGPRLFGAPIVRVRAGAAGMKFARWLRQAAYRPTAAAWCQSPHRAEAGSTPARGAICRAGAVSRLHGPAQRRGASGR